MSDVLAQILAAPSRSRRGASAAIALGVHLGLGAYAASHMESSPERIVATPDFEAFVVDELPPAPPLDEPPPPPAEEAPLPPASPRAQRASAPPASAPPAAAADVLTASADAPADLTSIVVGTAETAAGGATSATGQGTRPGGIAVQSNGLVPNVAPAVTGPDLTRPPELADGASWSCPFPAEADQAGIDEAVVRLSLDISASGRVEDVRVSRDPGSGFGRQASACAREKSFRPALDREGRPTAARLSVNVRFRR